MKIIRKISVKFSKEDVSEIRRFREFLESIDEEDWADLGDAFDEQGFDLSISDIFDGIDDLLLFAENNMDEG